MPKKMWPFIAKTRMAVILSSVFCAFSLFAQASLPEKLSEVLITKDMNKGFLLYNQISDFELKQLPDSALFYYHYLGAYFNSDNYAERPNHEKTIYHLKEAKRICDTSLGTHFIGYMEIMHGLGDEYFEDGEFEEALAIYEEGLIKSMAIREGAPQFFANLIMGIQGCYENLGLFSEVPTHLKDAWGFWDKSKEPFDFYNYWPLWKLRQYYIRYQMYDEAIPVSEMIVSFIKNSVGDNHISMADELYMSGVTFCLAGKNEDGIDCYRKGLEILKKISGEREELYGIILGNLLLKEIETGIISEYEERLKEIMEYGEKTGNMNEYTKALYYVSDEFCNKGDYKTALSLNDKLLRMPETEKIRNIVLEQRSKILYNKELKEEFPNIETQFKNQDKTSKEWFDAGHKLASAYFISNEKRKMLDVLKLMYSALKLEDTMGKDYYYWILNNLYSVSLELGDEDNALIYALEKWQYVSSITDMPDDICFRAINNLVVAKLRSSQLEGIDSDLDVYNVLCVKLYGDNSSEYSVYLHNVGRAYQLQGNMKEAKRNYLSANTLYIKNEGKANSRTVQYLKEVEEQLVEEGLDLDI